MHTKQMRWLLLGAAAIVLAIAGAQRAKAGGDATDMYDWPESTAVIRTDTGNGQGGRSNYMPRRNYGEHTTQTVMGWLRTNPDYSDFVAALDKAQLAGQFDGTTAYTVFAPTNAAFDKLPAGTWQTLQDPGNQALLAEVLNYAYLPGNFTADDLAGRERLTLQSGDSAFFSGDNGDYMVDYATVTQPDVVAANGTIQGVDTLLLPPPVVAKLEGQGYTLTAYEMNNGTNGVVMASTQNNPNNQSGADVYGKCGGPDSGGSCGGSKCGGCNKCGGGCSKCGGGCNKCNSCNKCNRCGGGHKWWHIHW
jgi:uncharacterized surface protein with fasciclin (FAS1) repeats